MNKKVALAVSGLAAITVVGGSFAYFNATQSFSNPFSTTSFAASSVEKFNPNDGENWKPGVEVNKEVIAKNTGDGDVWVRIKFDEEWSRGTADNRVSLVTNSSSDKDGFLPTVDNANQQDATDGLVITNGTSDKSVVNKKMNLAGWTYSNGYYYYNTALGNDEKTNKTNKLLEAVTLCKDTDMGKRVNSTYYLELTKEQDKALGEVTPTYPTEVDGVKWVEVIPTEEQTDEEALQAALSDKDKVYYTYKSDTTDENAQGYSNADYVLNITTDFVQADRQAAEAFKTGDEAWTYFPGETTTTEAAAAVAN